MREFIKVMCIVMLMVSSIAAVFFWADDRPNAATHIWRIITPAVTIVSLIVFLVMHFRKDQVPDFLKKVHAEFFDSNGFCFSASLQNIEGNCYLQIYYQSKYEGESLAQIAFKPKKSSVQNGLGTIAVNVDCPSAGFGVVMLPIPIGQEFQGKAIDFYVGASVEYPNGKGQQVRYRDGMPLRTNLEFSNKFLTATRIAAVASGPLGILESVAFSEKEKLRLEVPIGVAEIIPESLEQIRDTLWQLGDDIDEFEQRYFGT